MNFDVVIVGAGPAGLAAAYAIIKNNPDCSIALIEAGQERTENSCLMGQKGTCLRCATCSTISGIGGCFLPSHASKLSFPPSGKRLSKLLGEKEYNRVCEELWDFYCEFTEQIGVPYPTVSAKFNFLKETIDMHFSHLTLKNYPIHISSEKEHYIFLKNLKGFLSERITLVTNCCIDLNNDLKVDPKTIKLSNGEKIHYESLFIATGRKGYKNTQLFFMNNDITKECENINFGVRYALPSKYLNVISECHPDFKVKHKKTICDLETFCFSNNARGGRVVYLKYDTFLNIDGHISINKIGDEMGNEIVGNFAVLFENRTKSTSFCDIESRISNSFNNTFKHEAIRFPLFMSGQSCLSDFFDDNEFKEIIEFSMSIFNLIAIINQISIEELTKDIFVYGPEIENIWGELRDISENFKIADDIYAIGDCTGLAQGIISSMVMGYKAGENYVYQ